MQWKHATESSVRAHAAGPLCSNTEVSHDVITSQVMGKVFLKARCKGMKLDRSSRVYHVIANLDLNAFNSNCPYIDAERCQVTRPVYVPLYTCVWICLLDPVQKSIFWWEGKESIFRPRNPGDTLSSKRKGWKVEDTQDEHYFFTGGPETGCGCVARFKSTKGSTTCSRMCSEKVPHYSFPKWIWILCIAWLRSPSFASLLL